jgi:ABC-2 type transport system ATP-binding protein
MIRVDHVTRRYGDRLALDDVSLDIGAGQIVGLLGPNGAGKSTLIRIVAGLQTPDTGAVSIAGHDVWRAPIEARRALGYMAEEPTFYDELSPLEYLSFLATLRALDPRESRHEAERLLARLGLAERSGEPVARFSHGMRKKLSFVAAILHRPRALFCDEALEGFDLEAAIAAREELIALARGRDRDRLHEPRRHGAGAVVRFAGAAPSRAHRPHTRARRLGRIEPGTLAAGARVPRGRAVLLSARLRALVTRLRVR